MNEKFYPPSKEKLELLRQNGTFALSNDLISLFLAFSFALSALYFFSNCLDQLVLLFRNALLEQGDYLNLFRQFFKLLVQAVLVFLIPAVVAVILSVLIQSKFLVSFVFFRMRFDELFGALQRICSNFLKNTLIFFFSLIKTTSLFFFLYFFLMNLIEVEILEYSFIHLAQDKNGLLKLIAIPQTVLTKAFSLSLLIMAIISVLSLLFSHIYFRKVHAMTSKEFSAESD